VSSPASSALVKRALSLVSARCRLAPSRRTWRASRKCGRKGSTTFWSARCPWQPAIARHGAGGSKTGWSSCLPCKSRTSSRLVRRSRITRRSLACGRRCPHATSQRRSCPLTCRESDSGRRSWGSTAQTGFGPCGHTQMQCSSGKPWQASSWSPRFCTLLRDSGRSSHGSSALMLTGGYPRRT